MSIYNNYFDSMKSEKDIDEMSEKIISVRKKRIPVCKRFTVVLAAVFMALGVSVTAYAAANNWDFNAILESWFGGKAKLLDDCLAEVTIENMVDEMEDADISIRGAVCDNGITTIFFDIERTDGKIFDETPIPRFDYFGNPILDSNNEQHYDSPQFEFDGGISIYDNENKNYKTSEFIEYAVKDEDPQDNKLTIAAILQDYNDIYDYIINDENKVEVSILFYGIRRSYLEPLNKEGAWYHKTDYYIKGKWYVRASFDYTYVKSKTIATDSKATISFHNDTYNTADLKICENEVDLKEITVTNLSLMLELEFDRTKECYYPITNPNEGIGKLYMKDGSSYTIGGDYSIPAYYNCLNILTTSEVSRAGCNARYMLPEPIDINEVDYIEISGNIYKF